LAVEFPAAKRVTVLFSPLTVLDKLVTKALRFCVAALPADIDELMEVKSEESPITLLMGISDAPEPIPPVPEPMAFVTRTWDSVSGVALGGTAQVSVQVVNPSMLL
jgi:hypothetical protein